MRRAGSGCKHAANSSYALSGHSCGGGVVFCAEAEEEEEEEEGAESSHAAGPSALHRSISCATKAVLLDGSSLPVPQRSTRSYSSSSSTKPMRSATAHHTTQTNTL